MRWASSRTSASPALFISAGRRVRPRIGRGRRSTRSPPVLPLSKRSLSASRRATPIQLWRPSLAWPSSQSDKLPVLFFVFALRLGAAGAGGGAAASLAKRSALSRSVFARSAAAVDSYSDVAFLASLARCILANCAFASCLLGLSAISPSFSVTVQRHHCHSSPRGANGEDSSG